MFAAVQACDWTALPGWDALAVIADRAEPESMVVYTETMTVSRGAISATADLTVTLHYDARPEDDLEAASFEENFPALLSFAREGHAVRLTKIDISVDRD